MAYTPIVTDIERFLKAADNAAKAKDQGQREATRAFLIKRATALRGRRDALRARMETGWAWLDENADDPDYEQHETRLIAWIADYERICDALNEGLHRWLGTPKHEPRKEAA